MLLFVISARLQGDFSANDGFFLFSSFGFDSGGSYNASFSKYDHARRQYCFALVPTEDTTDIGPSINCSSFLYHHIVGDGVNTANGTITTAGIYHPYFSDHESVSDDLSFKIDATFHNPTTFLDSRWSGVFTLKIAIVAAHLALLIVWIVNWGMHFSVQIWIHYFLTGVIVAIVIYQLIRTGEFYHFRGHDDGQFVVILRYSVRIGTEALFYATILLIAKGWCIVRDVLPLKEILKSLIYSFLFMLFKFLVDVVDDTMAYIVLMLLTAISMALFMRELLKSTNDAFLYIMAHLLAIANEGINARSTPIFQKYRMYRRFQIVLLIGSLELIVYLVVAIVARLAFVGDEAATDVLVLSVFSMLAFVFRLRGEAQASYLRIADDEEGGEAIQLADLEAVDLNSDRLNGGREWESGMRLPGQPEIVRPEPTNVVIASPDGTATVEAGVANL
jgi:hypothetical protein